jgi:catechol 2,3-dioxygenase-like lactoylglutathione lyase family enzyme
MPSFDTHVAAIAGARENAKSIPARICATILLSMPRFFDHIDLRVRDRARAQKFYSRILPALGFEEDKSEEEWGAFYVKSDAGPAEFFAFDEDTGHVPNKTRIAFWADTREEVDRISEVVREAGGRNLEGPQIWTEYTPGYYALFFEDPDGNKLEVCCRGRLMAG